MFLFLPDADFAVETDSTWVERCAYIFDDIFRINRFASTVPFHDFRAVRIQGFGEFVDGIFICVFSSDEVHRAYVHARERFCLSFVGIGRDSYSVKEGVVCKERLFRCVVERNKEYVLGGAGLRSGWCWDRTTNECRGGGTVR